MEITEKTNDKRPGAGKAVQITKDNNIDEILQFNKEGYSITFKGDEDFINLSTEDFTKLPKSLLVYYTTAMAENNGQLHKVTETITQAGTAAREFGYNRRVADPGDQLEVQDVPNGMRVKWVRATDDRISKFKRKGYIMARDGDLKTFANEDGKGGHYVGDQKKPEMVAMLISEENFKINESRIKRAATDMKAATKDKYRKAVESAGRGGQADFEEKHEESRG